MYEMDALKYLLNTYASSELDWHIQARKQYSDLYSKNATLRTENARLQEALIECQGLLVNMVNQYCRNNSDEPTTYSHDFMSTGEAVFEYLVNHGLAEWAGGEDIRLKKN